MAERFYERETGNQVHAWQVPDGPVMEFEDYDADPIKAHPGEWVVEYAKGYVDVVDDESFTEDYERCGR